MVFVTVLRRAVNVTKVGLVLTAAGQSALTSVLVKECVVMGRVDVLLDEQVNWQ